MAGYENRLFGRSPLGPIAVRASYDIGSFGELELVMKGKWPRIRIIMISDHGR